MFARRSALVRIRGLDGVSGVPIAWTSVANAAGRALRAGRGAVVVGDTTVDWVGCAATLPAEFARLPRTDYPGSTITPGLIDSHVHLGFDGGAQPAARMRSETDEQQLVLMLHNARDLLGVGVTTARDLGARAYLDVVVRDAIAAGLARGPRLVVAIRPITVT